MVFISICIYFLKPDKKLSLTRVTRYPGTTLQLLFLIFYWKYNMYMYVAHLHMDVFQSTGRVTV